MTTHERFFRPAEPSRTSAHLQHPLDSDLAARKARPGCGSVARNRARRYLAKRRLPKGLWPIVAAVMLIAIIFDRQIQPVVSRSFDLSGSTTKKDRPTDDSQKAADPFPTPAETGTALHGEAALRCKPPADFHAKHVAQILAFLIRNRDKLDNNLVREKWRHLDRISLPLAVFLRDVEGNEGWSTLEAEISRWPLSSYAATANLDMPSSLRHRRILELTREWQRRGEEMLNPSTPETVAENDEPDPKDDDDRRPKP